MHCSRGRELRSAQRILVVGHCGAGKSWLAAGLATLLGRALVPLDDLAWVGPGVRRAEEHYLRMLSERTAGDAWIVEGMPGGLPQGLLDRVDLIIWLDLGYLACAWRVFLRLVRQVWCGGRNAEHVPARARELLLLGDSILWKALTKHWRRRRQLFELTLGRHHARIRTREELWELLAWAEESRVWGPALSQTQPSAGPGARPRQRRAAAATA